MKSHRLSCLRTPWHTAPCGCLSAECVTAGYGYGGGGGGGGGGLCRLQETEYMGIQCGYHYSPAGISILAAAVADAIEKLLRGS